MSRVWKRRRSVLFGKLLTVFAPFRRLGCSAHSVGSHLTKWKTGIFARRNFGRRRFPQRRPALHAFSGGRPHLCASRRFSPFAPQASCETPSKRPRAPSRIALESLTNRGESVPTRETPSFCQNSIHPSAALENPTSADLPPWSSGRR